MITKEDNNNPYIGPQPFEQGDKDLFFGRQIERDMLVSYIIAHRTLLLYAKSGAGKTSIMNAAVIPELEKEGFEILPTVRVGILDEENTDFQKVENIFVYNTLMCWTDDSKSVDNSIVNCLGSSDKPRLLVFDQFEELFTTFPERWPEREKFIQELIKAIDNDPLLRLVIVIREDYMAQMDAFSDLFPGKLRIRFRLERLKKNAALKAITQPLKECSRSFAEGAAEKLADELLKIQVETINNNNIEVVGEYIEPVQLQLVCFSLWENLPDDVEIITIEQVESFSDIDRVLAEFYEKSIISVCSKTLYDINKLRKFFDKKLITKLGTRGTIYRDKEDTGKVPNKVIEALEKKHLIRAERRAGARWYELTHDRFIKPILKSNEQFEAKMIESKRVEERKKYISSRYNENEKHEQAYEKYNKLYLFFEEYSDVPGQLDSLSQMAYIKHYVEYDYKEAIEIYNKIIQLNPDSFDARNDRAAAYWYSGKLEKAYNDYTYMMNHKMGDYYSVDMLYSVYHNRGQILGELGRFKESIYDLTKAINLRVEYGLRINYARNGLAYAYGGVGDYNRAFSEFELAIYEHPENAWVYFNRAKTYEKCGDINSAIKDYEKSLELTKPQLSELKRNYVLARLIELKSDK